MKKWLICTAITAAFFAACVAWAQNGIPDGGGGNGAVTPIPGVPSTPITNSATANVVANNVANYFTGASLTLPAGASGTWFFSGVAAVEDSTTGNWYCRIQDSSGTPQLAGSSASTPVSGAIIPMAVSGLIANPVSPVVLQCRDTASTAGNILFNQSGNSKDTTLTGYRVQ